MRSDREIKEAVEQQLLSDGDIDPTDIAVAVKDRVVMVAGFIRSYRQKRRVESDAKIVTDVVAVANDVEVRAPVISLQPDPKVAREAVYRIQHALRYSCENIKVIVEGNRIRLEGLVDWTYQRQRAALALAKLKHARGIKNRTEVLSRFPPAEIKRQVEEAVKQAGEGGAGKMPTEQSGTASASPGAVRSWVERASA